MTKPKNPPRSRSDNSAGRTPKRPGEDQPADAVTRHLPSAAAIRETIESVAIAVVLAFLIRTFEAEAFVIPTGSMAPTLMGRHKDFACPKCGCPYQVSASEEVDPDGNPIATRIGDRIETVRVEAGTCPMCRYTADLGPGNRDRKGYPSYNGDRILVNKFAYEFGDPKRWDVVVFKYPGDAPTNFIKRLVGLPGETIRIQNGDIWARRGEEPFQIARKPPQKLLAMLQPVFDNDYMPRIAGYGWPARWHSDANASAAGAWASEGAAFRADGAAAGENWLRYHHLVPSFPQWQTVEMSRSPVPTTTVQSQLITDFTAYNTSRSRPAHPASEGDALGAHWVGDLAIECTVEVESTSGELVFELCKGGRQLQCRFDVATGQATLSISGQDMQAWRPTAPTDVRGTGRHNILFSNCDNELLLWVDGKVVAFDSPTAYADLGNTRPEGADLAPVGVASAGARVRIGHLRVLRDIYYVALSGDGMRPENGDVCYAANLALPNKPVLTPPSRHYVDFTLRPDQFFVLGDNSAKSKDGRLWGAEYWVGRELLIGKASFIYWPHSWDKIPYVDLPFPYFPNVGRMGIVR